MRGAVWQSGGYSFTVIMNKDRQVWTFKSLLAGSLKTSFPKASGLMLLKDKHSASQEKSNCCKMFYVDTVNVAEMWKCRLTVRQG